MSELSSSGASPFKNVGESNELTDFDRKVLASLERVLFFGPEFKAWLPEWVASSGLSIPITQIQGFSAFTASPADTILTDQGTFSTSYTDLATVGPQLTGLEDGKYLVLYGAAAKVDTAGGEVASMSISVNGAATSDDNRCRTSSTFSTSIFTFAVVTLSSGNNNTITAKYKSSVGTTSASFADRKLVAFKYDNN